MCQQSCGQVSSVASEHFTKALYTLLDETFDNVHGAYLDKGTSLFETLADISAAEASIPIAVIAHTAYHLGEIRQALCTIRP